MQNQMKMHVVLSNDMHFHLRAHAGLQNDAQKQVKTLAISLAASKSAFFRNIAGRLHDLPTSLASSNFDCAKIF